MTNLLIILACVPLYVLNSLCDKRVSADGDQLGVRYNCVKFLLCSLCTAPLLLLDSAPKLTLGCLVCGAVCGICYAISKTIILKGYERTSVAYMTVCHSAGMILPCLLGHFFWDEPLNALSTVGILLAIVSVSLLKTEKEEKKRRDGRGLLFGVLVFLTSGGVMVAQKLMGRYFIGQSVWAYNLYSFVVAFLLITLLAKPSAPRKTARKTVFLCALGSAISLCVISIVMTTLASSVPSAILFPLFNGSGIILVCLGSALWFKERLSVRKCIALGIGIVGLCLVNF